MPGHLFNRTQPYWLGFNSTLQGNPSVIDLQEISHRRSRSGGARRNLHMGIDNPVTLKWRTVHLNKAQYEICAFAIAFERVPTC